MHRPLVVTIEVVENKEGRGIKGFDMVFFLLRGLAA